MKNVVIIGGGTGTFTLLSGLRAFPLNASVVVSSADNGGSTGRLRSEVGIQMPIGDVRQCLVGLSYTDPLLQQLFNYRFSEGTLSGHAVGNLVLAALEKLSGSMDNAIAAAASMLNVRGEVLPVTLFPTIITATLRDGTKVVGEHAIDEPEDAHRASIQTLSIAEDGPVNPRVIAAILRADTLVFGPGDLFTSLLPNILVKGVREAILASRAKKVFVVNIMTKPGQSDGFKASNFVEVFQKYLCEGAAACTMDVVIVNTKKPDLKGVKQYLQQGASFVEPDMPKLKKLGCKVIASPLLCRNTFVRVNGDVLLRSFLRHDPEKTAKLIWDITNQSTV